MNDRLNVVPISVMLDFERAAKNAYMEVFGDGFQIKFCLFHLGQSIHRRIQRDGLVPLFRDNDEFRKLVRSLAALAFLREFQVIPGFDVLRRKALEMNLPPNALSIFDYFERYCRYF